MRNEAVLGIQIMNIKEICSLVSIIPAVSTQALCAHFVFGLVSIFLPLSMSHRPLAIS